MDQQPVQQQGVAAPQYSTDGRWWWNGREWQPVSQPDLRPPSSSQRIRPGRWLYFVAVLAIALGAAVLVVLLRGLQTTAPSALVNATRITAPGTTQVTLAEAGNYMISYEHHGSGNVGDWSLQASNEQKPDIPSEVSSMQLHLVSAASATPVSVHARSGDYYYTYSVGDKDGVVIAVFSVDRPGTYSLASQYANGQSQPQVVLAIAQGSPDDLFVSSPLFTTLGVLAGLGLSLVGLVIGGVTLFFRIRAKDRARAARVSG
jgi:hypothetical protein